MSQAGVQRRPRLASYFTAPNIRAADEQVRVGLLADDDARLAATSWTAMILLRADATDEDGPLVHGWACHAAFLAGVQWTRLRAVQAPPPAYRPWTTLEDRRLVELYQQGRPLRWIADQLERTYDAVRNRIKGRGLRR